MSVQCYIKPYFVAFDDFFKGYIPNGDGEIVTQIKFPKLWF